MSGIVVDISCQCQDLEFDLPGLTDLASSVVQRFRDDQISVSIAVVDDVQIVDVHKEYLDKDTVTDVISFDLSDDDESVFEIVVNAQQAIRQAQKRGHKPESELALYVVHGLLHNLGFDDIDKEDAQKMHRMEDEILKEMDYGITFASGDSGE